MTDTRTGFDLNSRPVVPADVRCVYTYNSSTHALECIYCGCAPAPLGPRTDMVCEKRDRRVNPHSRRSNEACVRKT